ncbi:deoxycytidyl transferase [Sporothrix epigloea]|uniref:Deoxycytidyl transferase n=1 Tax=Sporothrix epigloea TaxID=1892477 RepID=A0ABP0DJJ7_9PEZI
MANPQRDKNAAAVRKQLQAHKFVGEEGEEYGASHFGGFGDYFRRKKLKLQNEDLLMRQSVQGKPQIFKDISVHVASYTQPPPEELRRMLVLHGAQFIKYLDYKTMVTHIVASTLPPKKADEWRRLRVVRPAWVVDSIAAGRLLPWADYRLISEGPGQKQIHFGDNGQMAMQAGQADQMAGYREQSKDGYYAAPMQRVAAIHNRAAASASPSSFSGRLATTAMRKDEVDRRRDHVKLPALGIESGPLTSPSRGRDVADGCPGNVDESGIGNSLTDMNADDVDLIDVEDLYIKDTGGEVKQSPGGEPQKNLRPGQDLLHANNDDGEDVRRVAKLDDNSLDKLPQKPLTSEEHNALLLADPKIRKSSTANPDFLKQFYSESRLHHLSTWKAELKAKMQRLAAEKTRDTAAHRETGSDKNAKEKTFRRRYIMHVDFDSFFCAVSLLSAPAYVDKPTVVAHSAGEGSEIASCNYPARTFGIKNGMWMRRALELCPDLKVLPYDFPAYEKASARFYEAILDIGKGSVVQSVSVDEALVDVTELVCQKKQEYKDEIETNDDNSKPVPAIVSEQEAVDRLASQLRNRIKASVGCDVSVGIGGNILLAKIALRRAKPAGQYHIRPEDALDVLGELAVEQLPGVAYSISGKLKDKLGVQTVRDLRALPKERLVAVLGPKTGERLYTYARGIDHTAVGDQPVRKSVSADVNWGIRFTNQGEADAFVLDLCKELERRLLHEQVRGRSLTVKILRRSADAPLDTEKHLGHGKCDVFNKSVIFGVATHDAAQLGKEALSIVRSFRFSPGDLRGIGVQMQKLEPIKEAVVDSSQKKLSFGTAGAMAHIKTGAAVAATVPKTQEQPKLRTGMEEPLQKSRFSAPLVSPERPRKARNETGEPVELQLRQKSSPLSAMAFPSTQLFMPSNPDPGVLAELPPDIIRRLVGQSSRGQGQSISDSYSENRRSSGNTSQKNSTSRDQSPTKNTRLHPALELPSDIDPEVFDALPADMRAEVLSDYRRRSRQQSYSPARSPHRNVKTNTVTNSVSASGEPETFASGKKKQSPVKRGLWGTRCAGAVSAARERRLDVAAGRVQTNLYVPQLIPAAAEAAKASGKLEELDEEVLAALPDDMRNEILEEYFRRREGPLRAEQQKHAQTLRFDVPAKAQDHGAFHFRSAVDSEPDLQALMSGRRPMLQFPPPPPKMSFRTATDDEDGENGPGDRRKAESEEPLVLSLADTKKMLKTWHGDTRDDGPHETDVGVLERYLAGVVTQERNMDKARMLIVWLEWLVGESDVMAGGVEDGPAVEGPRAWRDALDRVKEAVQEAMLSRGLPRLAFD